MQGEYTCQSDPIRKQMVHRNWDKPEGYIYKGIIHTDMGEM